MKINHLKSSILSKLVNKDIEFTSLTGTKSLVTIIYQNQRFFVARLDNDGEIDESADMYEIEMDFTKLKMNDI